MVASGRLGVIRGTIEGTEEQQRLANQRIQLSHRLSS